LSKLGHLIEQARKTRRVNEMFKAQTPVFTTTDQTLIMEILQVRLGDLEEMLFENPYLDDVPADDLIAELETIANTL